MNCFDVRAQLGIVAVFLVREEVVYGVLHAEKVDETGNHCQWKLFKEGAG